MSCPGRRRRSSRARARLDDRLGGDLLGLLQRHLDDGVELLALFDQPCHVPGGVEDHLAREPGSTIVSVATSSDSSSAIWMTGWSSSPCSTSHVMSRAASKIISLASPARRSSRWRPPRTPPAPSG